MQLRTHSPRRLLGKLALVATLAFGLLAASGSISARSTSASAATTGLGPVAVEPAAGYSFVDQALSSAKKSIDLSIYELSDTTAESILVARAHAGVKVRVLLDSAYAGANHNAPAASLLSAGGVKVVWAPSSQIFHAKYVVIDGASAWIGTGNLTSEWYSSTRDFWVKDTSAADLSAIESVFAADVAGRSTSPSKGADLVWSPGATSALVGVIASAHKSVIVENEEMASWTIINALEAAKQRGVVVTVVMTSSSSYSRQLSEMAGLGIKVRILSSSQVYIHAKAICADCSAIGGLLYVGSQNFSTSSLSYNRELGVITGDKSIVAVINPVLVADAAAGRAW